MYPVCSQDADESYVTSIPAPPPHPADCDGWLGVDADERPIPCEVCKPHLKPRLRRQRGRIQRGLARTR